MFRRTITTAGLAASCAMALQLGCTSAPEAPTRAPPSALTAEQCQQHAVNGRTRICHATGSPRNPYVLMNAPAGACAEHAGHAGDYVTSLDPSSPLYDPTCSRRGCVAAGGAYDGSVACCAGLVAQGGRCVDLCAGVTCAARDACHLAGTCDPNTGACSSPVAPEGAACSDGNACTTGDACRAGVCTSGAPVTCAPSDGCHLAGTCDPSTGACTNPVAPERQVCDDGNAGTVSDYCAAGSCVGGCRVGVDCPSNGPVVAGEHHTCALRPDGTVRCWGAGAWGLLGDGVGFVSRIAPVTVVGLTGVVKLAAGAHHTCAVLSNGTVRCWGYNAEGQLGDGTSGSGAYSATPVAVAGITDAVDLVAGESHTCAVLSNGTARCWGKNDFGQLGDGTTDDHPTPVAVVGLANVRQIDAGNHFNCATLTDGTLRCWGASTHGQLGEGTTAVVNPTPVAVPGLTGVLQVAAGAVHTCALLSGGTARCWGNNTWGYLGDGTTNASTAPVAVVGLTGARQLSANEGHTCAVLGDGTARCWGDNRDGELGDGTLTPRSSPVAVSGLTDARHVAAGRLHTCATRANGAVHCWGQNSSMQLGDGTTLARRTPVAVVSLDESDPRGAGPVVAGEHHTCALRPDGTVRCWGAGAWGLLGDGVGFVSRIAPVTVVGLTGVVKLAAGAHHTCAVLSNGTVRCWGYNAEGQLGDGTSGSGAYSATPVAVAGITDAVDLVAGESHTCAVLSNGTARCWGKNDFGQLGDGTTDDHPTPVAVVGLANVRQIDAGNHFNCATLTDGTLRCWGASTHGQLGEGTTAVVNPTPVAVPGLTGVLQVAAGAVHTCALLSGGTARCWGNNTWGYLGDGTTNASTAPVAVVGLTGARQLSANEGHTCAVLGDGTARCWGDNRDGELGDGTLTPRSSPVAVSGFTEGRHITTGRLHTCALRSTGLVQCWGHNSSGQLGDGTTVTRLTPVSALIP